MPNFTDEQIKAIYDNGNNIIVSAGAGSGKTAVLSERILVKLKQGIDISNLLVLTFTEAAALEMKTRIKQKVLNDPLTCHMANSIDSAYITTFDSYALSIVKRYHYLLNIEKNINIIDKSILKLFKKNILNDIFEEYYLKNDLVFLEIAEIFSNKNDFDLKEQILDIDDKLDLKFDKLNYLEEYQKNFLNNDFLKYIYSDFTKYILNLKDVAKTYFDIFVDKLSDKVFLNVSNFYNELFDSNDIKKIIDLLSNPLPRISGLDSDYIEYKEIFLKIIKEIKEAVLNYGTEKDFIDLQIINNKYILKIIEILKTLTIKVNDFKNNNLFFDFSDIAKMAIRCLKENKQELDNLKNSLNEILLDEYQDTNDLQEEFIKLIENNNVYMVGDVKQSIYRFRNANPNIFISKYLNYKNNPSLGIKIDLTKNFRSRNEVVFAINLIFKKIMTLNYGGADYINDHIMQFGNIMYEKNKCDNQNFNIEFPSYNYDNEDKLLFDYKEVEMFYIANDILNKINNKYQVMSNNKLRNVCYSDFAVLIDKSNNFLMLGKVFDYFKIPFEIIKNDDLTQNSFIYTFSNLLYLVYLYSNKIYNEEFKMAYMSIARSFIFNYTDEKIATIINNNELYNTEIIKKISNISKDILIKSNNMLINEIIDEFNIINKLINIGEIEQNLMRIEYIYNLSKEYSKMGYVGFSFIQKLKEILDNDFKIEIKSKKNKNDSVKILTIHKSKGLEYPIVYLPFLSSNFFNSDQSKNLMYSNYYNIILKQGSNDSLIKYMHLLKEKKDELEEKIRLFYVALTRAKEKIIVIRQNPTEEDNISDYLLSKSNSLNDLLNLIGGTLKNYTYTIDINKLNINKDYLIKRKNQIDIKKEDIKIKKYTNDINYILNDNKKISKKINNLIDYNIKNNLEYGKYMHEVMENIDFFNPNFSNIDKNLISHIKYFLNLDLLKDIKNAKIYKEYEFIYKKDNEIFHGIIDLLIEYFDKIIIIDYKLDNINDTNYIKQLECYKDYILSLNLNKKVKLYLFSFLEDKIIEI